MAKKVTNDNWFWWLAGGLVAYALIRDNVKKGLRIGHLEKRIEDSALVDQRIRQMLLNMLANDQNISAEVHSEITSIVELLEIKNESAATLKMGKIIENLLKDKFINTETFIEFIKKRNKTTKPVFADYIEFARKEKILSTEEYHQLSLLREYRNQEAHGLAVRKPKFHFETVLLVGIALIPRLCRKIQG